MPSILIFLLVVKNNGVLTPIFIPVTFPLIFKLLLIYTSGVSKLIFLFEASLIIDWDVLKSGVTK